MTSVLDTNLMDVNLLNQGKKLKCEHRSTGKDSTGEEFCLLCGETIKPPSNQTTALCNLSRIAKSLGPQAEIIPL